MGIILIGKKIIQTSYTSIFLRNDDVFLFWIKKTSLKLKKNLKMKNMIIGS